MGLRAARVILEDGWWRDDTGPLLLRQPESGQTLAAVWSGRAYRSDGEPVDPALCDALAWRFFPPLARDVSRFRGMAASVIQGLRREIALIASAALGSAVLGLLVPVATGWIFDDIVPAGASGLLIAAGLALFVAACTTAIMSAVRGFAVARVAGRGQTNMAAGVADRVLRLPARFFKSVSAGDFNQRLEALESIRQLTMGVILEAGLTLVFAIAYLALLFGYDARMALAGLALTLVYAGAVILSRIVQTGPLREAAERDGKLAGLTYEILDGLPKLRSAAAEPRALARWNLAYGREREAAARGQRVGNHFTAFAASWETVTLIGLFATAALLATGEVPPGRFIAFLAAFAIFQASFTQFCEAIMAIQTARPLAERARPILTAEPEAGAGRADPGNLTGDIQASGLSFGYDNAMAPLIDGLSFGVKPGEHLAIVGGSGSGKSTILRLLLGFETPLTGSLAYDGQELASLDPARVRTQIGVVLQSSQLFAGSIFQNIRGATNATLEQCMVAAEKAGLASDLATMPMGLHTPITEGAGTISGGQRQRILIARALAAEPAILFFDEATSALDNATQAIVARTLDAMRATRITIAHRLSTVRNADRICVLERGRFVESGSFTELMAQDGAFAALARRQLLED
jgi:NHLM bacteriocin system ABC transporter ATP-binding protein